MALVANDAAEIRPFILTLKGAIPITVEMAAFYRRMLSVGLSDIYQRDIGLALEKEDPPSELLLELAFCLSDANKTISILDNYIGDCVLNEYKIYPMILEEIRELYNSKRFKLEQIAEMLLGILEGANLWHEGPWEKLIHLSYAYDEVKGGGLYMEDFLDSFAEYPLNKEGRNDNND